MRVKTSAPHTELANNGVTVFAPTGSPGTVVGITQGGSVRVRLDRVFQQAETGESEESGFDVLLPSASVYLARNQDAL